MTVKLSDVIDALEMTDEEISYVYDPKTEKFFIISDDVPEEDDDFDEDAIDDYLALPTGFDIDDYQIIVDFIDQLSDEKSVAALTCSIHGRGAFRMFRATVERFDLLQDWYAFKDAAYRKLAIDWCNKAGLAYQA